MCDLWTPGFRKRVFIVFYGLKETSPIVSMSTSISCAVWRYPGCIQKYFTMILMGLNHKYNNEQSMDGSPQQQWQSRRLRQWRQCQQTQRPGIWSMWIIFCHKITISPISMMKLFRCHLKFLLVPVHVGHKRFQLGDGHGVVHCSGVAPVGGRRHPQGHIHLKVKDLVGSLCNSFVILLGSLNCYD